MTVYGVELVYYEVAVNSVRTESQTRPLRGEYRRPLTVVEITGDKIEKRHINAPSGSANGVVGPLLRRGTSHPAEESPTR